jgi:putative phage-type endonuclease
LITADELQAKWLADRRKGIGGSDVAAVFGEKYGCPRALFLDKTGVEPDYEHSEADLDLFDRGHALEPIVADRFQRETGLAVRRMPSRVSKDRPWMRVNVDRIIVSSDGLGPGFEGPGYLECKTAAREVFMEMRSTGMPEHYILQIQHGLAVTGWKWGAFAVLEPYSFRFLQFKSKRDEKLIAVILRVEDEFWKRVKAGDIPDKLEDFNDARCHKCGYRLSCRNAEALPKEKKRKRIYEPDYSPELDIVVGNIKMLDASIEEAEAQKRIERQKAVILMGDREAVLVPSQGKKLLNSQRSGRLMWDGKALDAEMPQLAARYKRRGEAYGVLMMYDAAEVDE